MLQGLKFILMKELIELRELNPARAKGSNGSCRAVTSVSAAPSFTGIPWMTRDGADIARSAL